MAYITNDGARLIERAKTKGKSIVFGSVRMNTIYKSDPSSLVQKSDEWFGANHGSVVGCLSHVSVDDVSCVCDSKLAIQCNDNSESWKSLGIYAHLDDEEGEVLFACESILNGEYKDVTIVELPITLDGVVEDFGLSEGGSGGGGGGDVPANMMTTNTEQFQLSGMKQWLYESFTGSGSIDNPEKYDRKNSSFATIGSYVDSPDELISVRSFQQYYNGMEWVSGKGSEASLTTLGGLRLNSGDTYDDEEHVFICGKSLKIAPDGVQYVAPGSDTLSATWANIINAANGGGGGGDVPANMMTTNTEQFQLSGMKQWNWDSYAGEGTADDPQDGDMRTSRAFSIAGSQSPLTIDDTEWLYTPKEGWFQTGDRHLQITSMEVWFNDLNATWSNIIDMANRSVADTHAGQGKVEEDGEGNLMIFGDPIQPNGSISLDGMLLTFDSSGYLKGVSKDGGGYGVATIGVIVRNQYGVMVANGRVSGVSMDSETPISFQSPIQLAAGYTITYQAIFSSI